MRLKLNRTLRAALIAAITAVGFTLTQAQAEETQLTVSPTDKSGGNINITWTEQTGDLNSWKLTFDLKVTNGNANDFFNISSNNGTAQAGWAIGTNGTTLQLAVNGKGGSPVITLSDAFTIGTAQNVTFQFERNVDDEGVSLGTGTFTIIANGQTGTYAVDSLTDTALVSGSRGHIWCNGNPGEHQLANITLYQLDDHQVVVPTSTWNGTEASHNWSDSVWNGTEPYTDGNKAVFGTEGYTTVSITTAVQAGAVSISGQDYTFEVLEGGSLTAAKANIADGASLTVTGVEGDADTVTIGTLTGTGNLTAGADSNVTVSALSEYTGNFGVTDGGTLTVGFALTRETLDVMNGTLNLGSSKHTIGKLMINDGGVVTTTHNAGDPCITGDIEINAGGTFKVIGGHDAFGYNTVTNSIIMTGEEGNLATLELNQTTANSATMGTDIVMHGYATITSTKEGGSAGFNTYDGISITVDGVENNIDVLDMRRNGVTINVAEGGEITVQKVTLNRDNSANTVLVKDSEGTLSLTGETDLSRGLNITAGTVDMSGTVTLSALTVGTEGTLQVSNGTTTVSGDTNVLSNTIAVTGGTLTLNGTYEIGGINSSGGTEYTDGQHEGNGYATATGDINVYITRDTGTVDATNATFTYRGKDVTVTEGVYTLPGEQDTTTYFINEGTDSYRWIDTNKKGELTGGIVVAEDATLQVDKDMNMSLVAASSKGTVQIDSGVVATAAGGTQTVTLAGAGAYALASGTAALGDVTLGEGWTGNVRISGNNTNGDWNALAREGSKLELYGVTGYAKQWAAENPSYGSINVDVVLTNDGDKAAFTATAGSSNTTYTTKFTGSVSGAGTFAASAQNGTTALRENYEFSGDISQWTGEFLFIKGVDTKVTFSEAADRIKSKVNRNNGNLAMVVNTARDAVFSKEVDVTSTTLDSNAQFEETAKLGNLSGAGNIEANDDLTIGGTSGYTGTIETDSALTVTGAADLSGAKLSASGDVIVAEGASLTLIGNSTIKNVIQNSGTVTLTGLTLGTKYFTETQGSEGAHFDLDDQETTGDNYFTGTSASYVLVVDGGTSTGTGLTWGDKTEQTLTDGKIITKAADIDHTSFHVGGEVSTSDINKVSGVESIDVVSGGNLHVDAVSEATIHAESGATVQGEQAQALVQIGENQTVTYADGIKVSDNGSAQFSGNVQVTNNDSETTFSVTNTAMEVQAETLTYGEGATGTLQIVCGVDVDNVTNQSGQDLILNTLVASELDNVSALSGDIVLVSTQGDLTINNLVINAEQAVQAIEIESGQTPEVTVTVTETLAAGGNATLLANLEMADDSALLLDGVQKGVSIGSELTMNTGIQLDEATLRALDDLAIGETFWLVGAVDGKPMEYTGQSGEDAWYDSVFSRTAYGQGEYTLQGDFNIAFSETDGFGLTKFSIVPEPATGTLSLLALMALAARRRRK